VVVLVVGVFCGLQCVEVLGLGVLGCGGSGLCGGGICGVWLVVVHGWHVVVGV